jgi:hypothetical protein
LFSRLLQLLLLTILKKNVIEADFSARSAE